MLVEIRQETSCYYSSPRHQRTLWGRYVYIYEGRGLLQANSLGLRLVRGSGTLEIPFKSIQSVGMGLFSKFAKPMGLTYLDLRYTNEEGEVDEIYLVPFKSVWDPTPLTSLSVQSWFETLRDQKELGGLIEPPSFDQPVDSSQKRTSLVFLVLGISALVAVALFGLISLG